MLAPALNGIVRRLRAELTRARLVAAAWLALGVGLVTISVLWQMESSARFIHGTPFADWQHYAMSWNRVVSGGTLFHPDQLRSPFQLPTMLFVGWAYSPASIVFWAPFAAWPAGYIAWTVVNVGLPMTALWAAATRTWPERRAAVFALTLVVLSQYRPFIQAAQLGSADLALAGLLAWAWLLGPRAALLAGVVGGAMKIVPLSMLLYASRYGWRWTLYGAAAILLLGLVTLPLVGPHSYFEFARTLELAVAPCAPARPDNVAIACQLTDYETGKVVGLLVGAAMAIGSALVKDRFWAFGLASFAYVAANPDLRGHTWVLVVPVAMAAVMSLAAPPSRQPATGPGHRLELGAS